MKVTLKFKQLLIPFKFLTTLLKYVCNNKNSFFTKEIYNPVNQCCKCHFTKYTLLFTENNATPSPFSTTFHQS